jgi:hypothetical protein
VVRRTTRRHGHLFTHLTAAVVVPGCLALCWWQVSRALGGNTLSWAYVFEWPIFAGYAVFMWWKLIHDRTPGRSERPDTGATAGNGAGEPGVDGGPARSARDVAEDEAMASYNRYLAALHASDESEHR